MVLQHKIGNIVMVSSLVIISFAIAFIAYSLFAPYNVADVETPIKLKNTTVKAGEPVIMELKSCTHKVTKATLDVQLIGDTSDAGLPIFSITGIPTKIGCQDNVPFPVDTNKLQLQLPSGRYRIRLHTQYMINSFRTITEDYDSEPFNYIAN